METKKERDRTQSTVLLRISHHRKQISQISANEDHAEGPQSQCTCRYSGLPKNSKGPRTRKHQHQRWIMRNSSMSHTEKK